MGTITAEVLPASAAIRLTVTSLTGIGSLTRSDSNGITDVRFGPGVVGTIPMQAEELRNRVQIARSSTGFAGTRCTFTASDTYYTRATADGTGTAYLYYNAFLGGTGTTIPVVAGDQLAANVQLRNSAAVTAQARLAWNFYDAAGTAVAGTVTGAMATLAAGAQPRINVTATAPAGAVQARPILYFYTAAGASPAAGQTMDWKYFAAYKGPAAWDNAGVYFDGSYASTDVYAYSWLGNAFASESVRAIQEEPFVITDYEAASGPVRYDLISGSGVVVSIDVPGFVLDGPWLFTPIVPGYSRKAVAVTGIDTKLEDRSSVFDGLLGRPDPVVVLRPPGLRSGSMEIYAGTYADALDILSPLQQATVMMLRQPEHAGMDMYFAPAGGSPEIVNLTTAAGRTVWGVKVPYVEVKRPEGDLAGALGWTYADLLAAVPRYSDLRRTFATYADMRINKRIS